MDTTQFLKGVLDGVGDASVYGTLRRLYASGALTSYVVPSDEGPHRKYYGITTSGRALLDEQRKAWLVADGGTVAELGDPRAYADELRTAAGLERRTRSGRGLGGVRRPRRPAREVVTDVLDGSRRRWDERVTARPGLAATWQVIAPHDLPVEGRAEGLERLPAARRVRRGRLGPHEPRVDERRAALPAAAAACRRTPRLPAAARDRGARARAVGSIGSSDAPWDNLDRLPARPTCRVAPTHNIAVERPRTESARVNRPRRAAQRDRKGEPLCPQVPMRRPRRRSSPSTA